jgi:superfamily II RNA helicase
MKVVFATETLAAGINMPARTSRVICSMEKCGEGGSMHLLETAHMLQMAVRAGRRGMDTDGTCVLMTTPFERAKQAIQILTYGIKPVE